MILVVFTLILLLLNDSLKTTLCHFIYFLTVFVMNDTKTINDLFDNMNGMNTSKGQVSILS